MLSLKEIVGKKVIDNYVFPKECIEYSMYQKMYNLSIEDNLPCIGGNFPNNCTVLIDTDFKKCVFQMLKLFKTNYLKLNEYNEKTKMELLSKISSF